MQFIFWEDYFLYPVYFTLFFLLVKSHRDSVRDREMRKYYMPGYLLKVFGAFSYGMIYQYYYGSIYDTTYFFYDGELIFEAFWENPTAAFSLIFGEAGVDNLRNPVHVYWSVRMSYFKDPPSYMISRFAGFFGLFCFAKYLPMSIFFATFSFMGAWHFYRTLCALYPDMKKQMAIAVFFFPSLFFWGSGVLKDSVTFCSLGMCVYGFYHGFLIKSKERWRGIIFFLAGAFLLKQIKIYILMCLIPSLAYWAFSRYAKRIDNAFIKMLSGPVFLSIFAVLGFFFVRSVSAGTDYDLDNIAREIKITSDYLRSVSKDGSFYYFGELDGTFENMLKYFVPAVLTTLYRPAIWEVRNPMMLLSALENTYLLFLTLSVFLRTSPIKVLKSIFNEEIVAVSLIFTLGFSFFVGLASANFGTLVRYKIPMMPFYIAMVLVIYEQNFVRAKVKKRRFTEDEGAEAHSEPVQGSVPEKKESNPQHDIESFRRNVIT